MSDPKHEKQSDISDNGGLPGNANMGSRPTDEYGNPIDGKPFDVDKEQQGKAGKQDVKS